VDADLELTHLRIGENQSRFRQTNEQIEAAADRWPIVGAIPFICECSREDCIEFVRLRIDEYEDVRVHPRWFVTVAGHQDIAVEARAGTVVAARDGYVIVESTGTAGEIADERYRALGED
jgi:hypothetical protein